MKPLNRPMFRYGGPIKEGVMSGIREPKKDGGLMNEPQAINTVGSPLAPQGSDGRQQYALPLLAPLAMAAGRALARPFGKFVAKRVPQFFAGPNKQYGTGRKIFEAGYKKKAPKIEFEPNRLGLAFKNDPLAKTVMGGTSMFGRGIKKTGKGIYAAGKYGTTTPSGIALTGATTGPFIYNALTGEKEPNPNNTTRVGGRQFTGMEEQIVGDPRKNLPDSSKKGGGVEMSAEERRAKNVERYRDIMDIKGMNKDAAYNSLIAASQAINESGDFKGDIKSGKLINQIIQATSKQFDKPKATKDAIDTLILKGEIEKDIKASDPAYALDAKLKRSKLAESQRSLNPTYNTLVAINQKANVKGQAVFDGAAKDFSDNRGETFRGNLISKSDFKDILSDLKKDPKTKNADDVTIIATWTQGELDSSQKNIPNGNYTVGDRVVTIKDKIVVDVN